MRAGASAHAAARARVTTPSLAIVGGYVLAYVALDWVSFIDPIGAFAITPWNPPPGLSLAFLLRYGVRQGPWLFVAALAAEFLVRGAPAPLPLLVAASLLLALSYTAVVAILTRVLRMSPNLPTLRDAAIFVVTAAIACGVIALAFVALFAGSGLLPPGEFWRGVTQFWIGDLIGIVVTAPALLLLTRTRDRPSLRPGPEALVEIAVIAAALWIVFGAGLGDAPKLFYVLFLPVIWIAMRHGAEGAVLGTVAIQIGLIAAIVASRQNPGTVFEFQFLMLALAATALLLGAAVSERKRIERELRENQSKLDRSLRLAAASELASALAHELNQPLSAITAYLRACQLMLSQRGDGGSELATTMDKIVAEANRAGGVVRRLRDFFRSGSTHMEAIAPAVLIEEALATVGERAKRHRVAIIQRIDATPHVQVDRVQIESVLHNLLANAVDAVKERADGREVRIEATAEGPGFIRITVADNGPGVAPDVATSLFDPFVTTKAKGMGLGLAISRSIVDAHGGRLWHEPRMPGSAFGFTLPVCGEPVT
jgi:signal transduction histidine kinase